MKIVMLDRNSVGMDMDVSIFEKLGELLRKSIAYSFIVERKGEVVLSIPVLIMIVIACSLFHVTVIAVLIGLFLDCRYSVEKRNKS